MMNEVIVDTWWRVAVESGRTIVRSFEKTNLLPLRPPSDVEYAGFACVSSIQCGTGKKATELEIVKGEVLGSNALTEKRTSNEMVILKAKNDTSRNLLIRAAAYEVVNKTVVVPAQELKNMQQEISHAKTIQVGPAADVRESRMNPDTTSGLFVTSEIRAHARRVDVLKNLDKQEAKERAVRTAAKNAVLSTKKKEAFGRIINSIVKEADNDMVKALTSHVPKTDIKLAFQHAGGQPKDCKDGLFKRISMQLWPGFSNSFVRLRFNARMIVPMTHLVQSIPAM